MTSRYDSLKQSLRTNKLAAGATVTFTVRVYGAAIAYLIQILLARAMGAAELGIYVFAWTCVSIIAFLSPLGFDNALVRFLAGYSGAKEWPLARGALNVGFRTTALIAIAISLVSICVILLSGTATEPYRQTLLIAFACLPLLALTNLHEGIARGFSWVSQVGVPSFALRPTLFITSIATAWWLGSKITSVLVICLMAIAVALTLAWQYWGYRKRLPNDMGAAAPRYQSRYWLVTAAPMVLVVSFEQLLANTDIIMLGLIEGPSATGIYNIAVRIAGIALFVFFAVSSFAAPRIAELHRQNRAQEIIRLSHNVRLAIALPTTLGLIILLIFAGPILGVFGEEFGAARLSLFILCIPVAVRALAGPIDNLLTMTGQQAALSKILGVTALLNIAANALLIPLYGTTGAACATASSVVLELVWVSKLVAKHTGYRSWMPYQ